MSELANIVTSCDPTMVLIAANCLILVSLIIGFIIRDNFNTNCNTSSVQTFATLLPLIVTILGLLIILIKTR